MRIREKLRQYRRDFMAVFECEHCGHTHEQHGYDDSYFHNHVVPGMTCPQCGKSAGADYKPMDTVHRDEETV